MDAPKYDGQTARAILGAYVERLQLPEAREAKKAAAVELFQALAKLKVPGVTAALGATGRTVTLRIGKDPFREPLVETEVGYEGDSDRFRIVANGELKHFSLPYCHAHQRFVGEVGPEATEEQRARSALAYLADAIVNGTSAK